MTVTWWFYVADSTLAGPAKNVREWMMIMANLDS